MTTMSLKTRRMVVEGEEEEEEEWEEKGCRLGRKGRWALR